MIRRGYGEGYTKDDKKQSFDDFIAYCIDRFHKKYPEEKIDFIECSNKDATENFMNSGINVKPKKWPTGMVWIKPIYKNEQT